MDHQDWTPVTLNKTNGPVVREIVEKKKSFRNPSVKLDENDEIVSIKKVSKEIAQLIINGRVAKKLTRKDLANNLSLQESIITDTINFRVWSEENIVEYIKDYIEVNKKRKTDDLSI